MSDRPTHHRNAYDNEYAKKPEYMAAQRARAKARYYMIKKYGREALKGKEIDHIKPLAAGGGNSPSNWRIRDASENRGDKSVFKHKGFDSYD